MRIAFHVANINTYAPFIPQNIFLKLISIIFPPCLFHATPLWSPTLPIVPPSHTRGVLLHSPNTPTNICYDNFTLYYIDKWSITPIGISSRMFGDFMFLCNFVKFRVGEVNGKVLMEADKIIVVNIVWEISNLSYILLRINSLSIVKPNIKTKIGASTKKYSLKLAYHERALVTMFLISEYKRKLGHREIWIIRILQNCCCHYCFIPLKTERKGQLHLWLIISY